MLKCVWVSCKAASLRLLTREVIFMKKFLKSYLILMLSLLILMSFSACNGAAETTAGGENTTGSGGDATTGTEKSEAETTDGGGQNGGTVENATTDTEKSEAETTDGGEQNDGAGENATSNTEKSEAEKSETETTGGEQVGGDVTSETEAVESETESPYLALDFTVYDGEGNAVKLSDFRGKPIVVNVWASTCGPCKAEMPEFQEAYEKYGDEVQFLMIDYIGFFGETVKSAQAYVDGQGYTFPVYFDSDRDAASTYGINAIPFTMFINEEFELYTYLTGMTDFETLEKYINQIK